MPVQTDPTSPPPKAPFVRLAADLPAAPGTFTPDDLEAMNPEHVTKLVNYLIAEHARKTHGEVERRNQAAIRAAFVLTALLCFAAGAVLENIRSSLFSRPIATQIEALRMSVDRNTSQLEKVSTVDAILRSIQRENDNARIPR
jgi:hypothetical protein